MTTRAPRTPARGVWTPKMRQAYLLVAWHFADDAGRARIAETFGEAEPALTATVARHRITWWAAQAGQHLAVDTGPWQVRLNQQRIRALRQSSVIAETLGLLTDLGAKPLLLKGQALSVLTTGDPAGRGVGDVDILIDPLRLDVALAALEKAGAELDPSGGPFTYTRNLRYRGEFIEVHHRLDPLRVVMRLTHADLWERRRTIDIAGTAVDTLGSADTILMAANHSGRDGWPKLRSLLDFVIPSLDQAGLAQARALASKAGIARRLEVAESMAEPLTGVADRSGQPSPTARRLAHWNWQRLAADRDVFASDEPRDILQRNRQIWLSLDTSADRREMLRAYALEQPQVWGAPAPLTTATAWQTPYWAARRIYERATSGRYRTSS